MASLLTRVSSGKTRGDFEVRRRLESDASAFPTELHPNVIRTRIERGRTIPLSLLLRLLKRTAVLIREQPTIHHIQPPVVVFGDLHGQLHDFLKMHDALDNPSDTNKYLFLGDYVDRGEFSVGLMTYILALKLSYPKHVYLIRGNHECQEITSYYGFMDECVETYGQNIYRHFLTVFNALPYGAIVDTSYGRWFCVHGGLSPSGTEQDIEALNNVDRFQEPDANENKVLFDMIWSDPIDCTEYDTMTPKEKELFTSDSMGWLDNESRGCSHVFGVQPLKSFLQRNRLRGIVRAHEFQEDGIGKHFDHEELKQICMPNGDTTSPLPPVTTLFSASNYCGRDGNTGAVLIFHAMDGGEEKKAGTHPVEIRRFAPVTGPVIDALLDLGEQDEEQERTAEAEQTKQAASHRKTSSRMSLGSVVSVDSVLYDDDDDDDDDDNEEGKEKDGERPATPASLSSLAKTSLFSSAPRIRRASHKMHSLDHIKMATFQEASQVIKSFTGIHSKSGLLHHAALYEKYTITQSGETRSQAHSRQLWKWAKAKLKENSVGRFKQHRQFKNTIKQQLVLKVTKKKFSGGSGPKRSSNELKPSFRENELSTTFGAHDLSVLDKNELRAVHLCYDMWDISASCEITEDDLETFYEDALNESEAVEAVDGAGEIDVDHLMYDEMVDVVRIIAADSFHITAADFLAFAIVMKRNSLEGAKKMGASSDGGLHTVEKETVEEELQMTAVCVGWEVEWSAEQGMFYYVKGEECQWEVPLNAIQMEHWQAVVDPSSLEVYAYCTVDGSSRWDFDEELWALAV